MTLRPHAAAIILVATSHACEPQPPQAYSAVAIALDGKTFVVRLPQREPDSPRTDLRLHVNRDCPPAVFAFIPAPS